MIAIVFLAGVLATMITGAMFVPIAPEPPARPFKLSDFVYIGIAVAVLYYLYQINT